MFGVQIEDGGAGEFDAGGLAVEAPEELVGAADGEQDDSVLDGVAEGGRLRREEVVGDGALLAVLCAAGEDEIVGGGVERVAEGELCEGEGDAARLGAVAEAHDVAAVAVDVHEARVEVGDAEDGCGHRDPLGWALVSFCRFGVFFCKLCRV